MKDFSLCCLLLVSRGEFWMFFKVFGVSKTLSFESGDYFPSVIVLVTILCQFFWNFVQLKQFEICVSCCHNSNYSTCR
jgi:hypothetical protein